LDKRNNEYRTRNLECRSGKQFATGHYTGTGKFRNRACFPAGERAKSDALEIPKKNPSGKGHQARITFTTVPADW
jgi:hypothetical protein